MKKIITILTVLLTVILSSCSNDEIPVKHTVKFTLNPATVVENLLEVNAGDLTSIDYKKYKLNIELYIYDEFGQLVNKDNQETQSYTNIVTSNLKLSNGEYTIVAISHVTSIDPNGLICWSFEGFDNLNTLKITDKGKIGGKNKFLGLTIEKINISDFDSTFKIDIQNAGVVACVGFLNWNRYNDIKEYNFLSNKSCNYLTTNHNGEIDYSINTKSGYNFRLMGFTYTSVLPEMYSYFFTFPIKDIALAFSATPQSGDEKIFEKNLIDLELGGYYVFTYDVKTEEAQWLKLTNNNSSRNTPSEVLQNSASSKPSIVYDYENMSISIK